MFNIVNETPDYAVAWELVEGMPFIHCEIRKWSHNVFKQIKTDVNYLRKDLEEQGFEYLSAVNPNQDDKWFKFMKLFDFEYCGDFNELKVYFIPTKVA